MSRKNLSTRLLPPPGLDERVEGAYPVTAELRDSRWSANGKDFGSFRGDPGGKGGELDAGQLLGEEQPDELSGGDFGSVSCLPEPEGPVIENHSERVYPDASTGNHRSTDGTSDFLGGFGVESGIHAAFAGASA